MMKLKLLSLVFLCTYAFAKAQVGIGTTTPQATLDIPATDPLTPGATEGILIPRVDEYPTGVTAAQDGMMVFLTGAGTPARGFYYWNNATTAWVLISGVTGGGGTLDQAYDFGGAGNGNTITATDGAVTINGEDGLIVTGTSGSGATIGAPGAGTRLVFNPHKAAIRAGRVTATQWDDVNVGFNSVAFGINSTASGNSSTALGTANNASGPSSFVSGVANTTSGINSFSVGFNNTASGNGSATFGTSTEASEENATSFGQSTTASGENATAFGLATIASGVRATSFGQNTNASGAMSTSLGRNNTASGVLTLTTGDGNTAPSYGETTIGLFATEYTPSSSTSNASTDRLFTIGNGLGDANRSNALTILKSGLININEAYNMPLTDGTAGQVMTTDGVGNITFQATNTITDTDNQQIDVLNLNGTNLEISLQDDGIATQTLDLSSLQDGTGTDDQQIDVLNLNGTNLEISLQDDGIATQTLDLSSLQDGTGTDNQQIDVLNLNGTNLEISLQDDGIVTQTLDLSSLQDGIGTDDQQIDVLNLNGTNLEISLQDDGIATQTLDLSSLNNNTQNTLNQAYNEGGPGLGNTITATDGAVIIDGEDGFEVTGNIGSGDAINASGAGSRMLFNPNKGAFRAGNVDGTQWDDANVGTNTIAFGVNTIASGDGATAFGSNTTASGLGATVFGTGNTASGPATTVFGGNNTASGISATAFGVASTASGNFSIAFGQTSEASNQGAIAFGLNTTASGARSTAFGDGSIASGSGATAFGGSNTAPSANETTIGVLATEYTPISAINFEANDRLFSIGNGASPANRSNALTILKSGLMNINDEYNMPLTDGTANQVMTTDGAGNVTFQDPGASGGTLDDAYDFGGAGAGNTITATDGAVTIDGEDGVLVTGTFGSGETITASGAGTRMFFNPRKAAFRAGRTFGTEWDNASVGNYSVAFSRAARASGDYSFAMGFDSGASGNSSFAFGDSSVASGDFSVSLGAVNTASGNSSIAVGLENEASGNNTTVFGLENFSQSYGETTMGVFSSVSTPLSATSFNINDRLVSIGNGTNSSNRSNALTIYKSGLMNINDEYNMPLTDGSANQVMTTDGTGNVTFQDGAINTDNQQIDVLNLNGTDLEISLQNDGVATQTLDLSSINTQNTLNESYNEGGAGAGNTITATNGAVTIAGEDGLSITGNFNNGATILNGNGPRMYFNPRKAAFRAGNVSTTEWNDANVGNYSTAFGFSTTASGNTSTAFGVDATASGLRAIAFGDNTVASGERSTAFGENTEASGDNATAFGEGTIASNEYSTAFGFRTDATAIRSTAFGEETSATGTVSTAFGINTIASGENTTAFGNSSVASGNNAIAFGNNTIASGTNAIAFGGDTNASGGRSTAFGFGNTAPSLSEVTTGIFATEYTPTGTISFSGADRIFSIGNGTSAGTRSNALTIFKSGLMNINDAYNMPLTDGTTGQVMTTDGAGNVTFQDLPTFTDTDNQQIDVLNLNGTNLEISLQDDGIASQTLDLSSIDTDTNTQNTLDQAYDEGGAGAGRTINVDNGAVQISGNAGGTTATTPAQLILTETQENDFSRLRFTNSVETTNTWTIAARTDNDATVSRMNFNHNGAGDLFQLWGDGFAEINGTLEIDGRLGININNPGQALILPNTTNNALGGTLAREWTTYSDSRVKSDQHILENGLSIILQTKPKTYFHHNSSFEESTLQIENKGEQTVGFIAQELYKVLPEAVKKPMDETKELWSVDYDKVIPIAVKAIQELKAEKDALSKQVQELEVKVQTYAALEARIQALENEAVPTLKKTPNTQPTTDK